MGILPILTTLMLMTLALITPALPMLRLAPITVIRITISPHRGTPIHTQKMTHQKHTLFTMHR